MTEESRPRNKGHLPHKKTCLVCKHTITAFKESEHQKVCCLWEMKNSLNTKISDNTEDLVILKPRKAQPIIRPKPQYSRKRTARRNDRIDNPSSHAPRHCDDVPPPGTSGRTTTERIEEIKTADKLERKPTLTVTTQLLARVKVINEDTLEIKSIEIPLNGDLNPIHENHKELWVVINQGSTEKEVIIIDD
ncbi:unnamed protein product [Trichogramma brassicae]|uniref:Uncharacterized protein n=1 Tax=Trichogramma brassicae TaxID=86971 RepID=A0A6H5I8M3_9HYME|nr:unnamed protein product [Trichogramma brassicae]